MHVTLAFALIFRTARVLPAEPLNPLVNDASTSTFPTQSQDITSTTEQNLVLNDFEDVCFSLVSIMAIAR